MPLLPSIASPMHGAVVPIAYINLTSPNVGFSFTNIPQGYQDLMLVCNARSAYAANTNPINLYINAYLTTNLSTTYAGGNGSSAYSTQNTTSTPTYGFAGDIPAANSTSGIFGTTVYHILNYANTSTFKTVLVRSAADINGAGFVNLNVGLYGNTSAVTSLIIQSAFSANYVSGSTFALYGIRSVGQ